MKVKFKVEKDYKGKKYYPNIEYVVDDDTGKDILSKTKYAEVVQDAKIEENASSEEQDASMPIAENEQKPTKSGKKIAKNTEKSQ